MKPKFLRENFWIVTILSLSLILAFYDIVFFGKTFKIGTTIAQALPLGPYNQKNNKPRFIPVNGQDSAVMEEPVYEFIKRSLQKGILPLWNPHQACGYPLIGMIEVGIFFPLNIILYLLPQLYAWDILIFGRFFFAGLFTYWFMRTLRFKKIPSLGSAVIFMLSGPMVMQQNWTANVEIVAPLLFMCLEFLVQKINIRNTCYVAGCVFLTFLGGHPEHIFFVNGFGFFYFCFRMVTRKTTVNRIKALRYLFLSYILGIGLSAMVLFPFLYNFIFEFWHAHPAGVGLSTGEIKNRIITLILPYFFQKESLTYDFTFAGWWGGYIGVLPFALALLSLFGRQKGGLNYFLAILAFLMIGKCYSLPIINWIGYLPVFSAFRFYPHLTHLFAFSIAVLAGMGIRTVILGKNLFKKGMVFGLGVFALAGSYLFYFRNAPHFSVSLEAVLLALGIAALFQLILLAKDKNWLKVKLLSGLLVIFIGLELFLYIPRERARRFDSYPTVPYIEFLKSQPARARSYGLVGALYPSTASAYQIDDLGIFISLVPKRFVYFINHFIARNRFKQNLSVPALRSSPTNILSGENPFVDLLNVKYVITSVSRAAMTPARPLYSEEVNIYKKDTSFPRSFIVHRVLFLPPESKELVFGALETIQNRLKETVVVEHAPVETIDRQLQDVPAFDNSQSQIIKYTPHEVILQATLEHPGFLVLSDAFHPEWKGFIDGRETEIFPADYLLRSVFVPAGAHEVRFVFRPVSFYGGVLVSLLSLIAVIVLFLKTRFSK